MLNYDKVGFGRAAERSEVRCAVKIVIRKKKSGKDHLMVELRDKKIAKEIRRLLNTLKSHKVKSRVLSNGKFVKRITEKDMIHEAPDLIITDRNMHWSHM